MGGGGWCSVSQRHPKHFVLTPRRMPEEEAKAAAGPSLASPSPPPEAWLSSGLVLGSAANGLPSPQSRGRRGKRPLPLSLLHWEGYSGCRYLRAKPIFKSGCLLPVSLNPQMRHWPSPDSRAPWKLPERKQCAVKGGGALALIPVLVLLHLGSMTLSKSLSYSKPQYPYM